MSETRRNDAEVLAALERQFPGLRPPLSPADVEDRIDRIFAAKPGLYDTDHLRYVGRATYLELTYEQLHREYMNLARLCLAAAEDSCAALSREGRS